MNSVREEWVFQQNKDTIASIREDGCWIVKIPKYLFMDVIFETDFEEQVCMQEGVCWWGGNITRAQYQEDTMNMKETSNGLDL